jgi:hypothetical protein
METIVEGKENPKVKLLNRMVLLGDTAILVYLALVKILIHLLTTNNYDLNGDELYWLAMSKHLDFGYVDVPPLVAYITAFSSWLFGTSSFALHILPAIAGGIMVFMAGVLARQLGGGRFAQWLTALIILLAPAWLGANSLFAYDPYDQLVTIIFLYLAVLIIQQETPTRTYVRRWLLLGAVVGIGIMTKLPMIFMGFALIVALLGTSWRKSFLTWRPWLAILITVAICTPYLVWESVHGWPTITYWRNYGQYRNVTAPLAFLQGLVICLHPFTVPIWVMGLGYLLFHREGKNYRVLGLIFIILLFFYIGGKFQPRLLVSACFPLLAGGAVLLERLVTHGGSRIRFDWLKPVYVGILLCGSILLAPYALPVLPLPFFLKYEKATPGIFHIIKKYDLAPDLELPFLYASRMGWPEMVKEVADVYQGLPEAEQKQCVIYTGFYWEAGAIDYYGKDYGLPHAICNHLSYQVWGPGDKPCGVVIAFGNRFGGASPVAINLRSYFDEVTCVGIVPGNKYSIPSEQGAPIYICRKPKPTFKGDWKLIPAFF